MTATLYDKVTLLPVLGFVVSKTILAAATGPFRGSKQAPIYGDHVLNTALRGLFTHMTFGQLQTILPPFVKTYEGWAKKNKVQPDIVDIPGTKVQGFWVGNKDSATYTMVYYHGGGFVMPGFPQHLDFITNMMKWNNGKLAIFVPCYTLAPGGVYPLQLAQSIEALRYVLDLPGRSPDNVLIAGDSAGGNLVLAVLSHISGHPHPQSNIVKPLEISGPLRGALMVAPWVSSDSSKFPSMAEFADRDTVNTKCANYWFSLYKGEQAPIDDYLVPELADPSWWSGTKASSVLATAGLEEGLRDSIKSWANKFEQAVGKDKFKLVLGEREIHDAPLVPKPESELEKLGDRTQEGGIRIWLKSLII